MSSIRNAYSNQPVEGVGHGIAQQRNGHVVCVVVGFDYKGYNAMRERQLCELSGTKDAIRFAALAKVSGAEVFEYYDNPALNPSMGFPHRDQVTAKIAELGQALGPQDTFVWFYGGHGMASLEGDADADEADGQDEELCFVEPDGRYMPLQSDHIAALLGNSFNPETHIIVVTDCCQSGTVCDLNRPQFQGRPICHLSSSPDTDDAIELEVDYTYGDGGAFTASLLESIEDLIGEGKTVFSVGLLHNKALALYSTWAPGEGYDPMKFYFETPAGLNPATITWPLVPPKGWCVSTLMDDRKGYGAANEHKAEVQRTGGDVVRLKQEIDAQVERLSPTKAEEQLDAQFPPMTDDAASRPSVSEDNRISTSSRPTEAAPAVARISRSPQQNSASPVRIASPTYTSPTVAGAATVKRMAKPLQTSQYSSGGVQHAQRIQYSSSGSPNVIRAQPASNAQPIRTGGSVANLYSGGSGGGLQPSPAKVYSSSTSTYSSPTPQMYSPSPAPRFAAPSASYGQQYASPYSSQAQYSGFRSPNAVYAGQPGIYHNHRTRHVEVRSHGKAGSPSNRAIVGGCSSPTLSASFKDVRVSYGRTFSGSASIPTSAVVGTPTSSLLIPSGALTAPVVHVI